MDLWVVFLTGLTVGGLTCLAVQGGLLASVIAAREEEEVIKGVNKKNKIFPSLAFIVSKLLAYTVLGVLLGSFGGAIGISQELSIVIQILAGLYMIAVALDLLKVHPIFRYAVFQPPRFLAKMVRNQSRSKELFAPALLGAMTIFIPCGTTLAMEALAISSGNSFLGGAILFTFVLGTAPVFLGVGVLTSILGDNYREKFLKVAAIAVLYLGITTFNGALVAAGSPISLQSIPIKVDLNAGQENQAVYGSLNAGVQELNIQVLPNGYNPNYFKVKAGEKVRINLTTTDELGCTAAFRIPSLKISRQLMRNSSDVVEFTPQRPGKIGFTCSMGMYTGTIEVI